MSIQDYLSIYQQAGKQYGVDPNLLIAQARAEDASGDPDVVGPDTPYGNAKGVAQLIPDTAKRLGVTDPTDPKQAIPAQAKLMAENIHRYGNVQDAVSAYHGGTDKSNWGPKTQAYQQKVLQNYQGTQMADNDNTEKNLSGSASSDADLDPFEGAKKDIAAAKAKTGPADADLDPFEGAKKDIAAQQSKSTQQQSTASRQANQGALVNGGENIAGFGAGVIHGALPVANTVMHGYNWLGDKISALEGQPPSPHPLETMGNALQAGIEPAYQKVSQNTPISSESGNVTGQIGATMPILGAGGEAAGLVAKGVEGVPYLGTAAKFLTGGIESDAQSNALGQTIQPATWTNKAARLASTVPVGAAGGATANALVGGSPEQGAEIGAAAGPVISLAGKGLSAAFSKGDQLSPAVNKLQQAFIRDGYVTPDGKVDTGAIKNKLTELGQHSTIADLGPNTRDLAGAVAQAPGAGKDIISTALQDRQAGQSDRLKQSVLSGLGLSPQDTYDSAVPKLIDQRQQNSTPLYKDAFDSNKSVSSPEINKILQTPAGKQALKNAVTTMQNSRQLVGVSDPDLVEQAALTGQEPTGDGIASGLKLKTLDQVKQELYDLGEAAKDKFGNATIQSRAIHGLRNDLTTELDAADSTAIKDKAGNITKPGKYAQARDAFAGPSQSLDALEQGKSFIKNGGAENIEQLAKMSDQDKQFYRIGAAKQIHETIQNTPDGADAVKRIFNTPAKRDALRSVFPDQTSFDNFAKQAEAESTFYRTKGAIGGNSLTNPRMQSSTDLATPLQRGVGGAAKVADLAWQFGQRNTMGKLAYAGQLGLNKILGPSGPLTAKDSEELANHLISSGGKKSVVEALTPTGKSAPLENYLNRLLQGAGMTAIGANPVHQPVQ